MEPSYLPVSRETLLSDYLALLQQWGRAINLTSAADERADKLAQHVRVSLALVPHLPIGTQRVTDLGSGQGFPAIPLAIETGCHVDLIEADRRKAAFLTTVLAKLKLRGTVWPLRLANAHVQPAACVTARALAPLSELLMMARPLLQPGGCCLFLKGRAIDEELARARSGVTFQAEVLPVGDPQSRLVKVTCLG